LYKIKFLDGGKSLHIGGRRNFTDHQNEKKKASYLVKSSNQDWSGSEASLRTAGFWSRYLLWNLESVPESMMYIEEHFDVIFSS
jgi:hypothetical protein